MAKGKLVRQIVTHHAVSCVALSSDGKELAIAGPRGRIEARDTKTGKVKRTFRGRVTVGEHLRYTPDGKWLLAAGHDDLQAWSATTGRGVRLPRPPNCAFGGFGFPATGEVLACGHRNRALVVWGVFSGRLLSTGDGHESAVRALVFTGDGSGLRSVDQGGVLVHWDRAGKEALRIDTTPKEERRGGSEPSFFTFSNAGKHLAYLPGGRWGLTLWGGGTGKAIFSLGEYSVLPPTFSADGSRVAVAFDAGDKGPVGVWEAPSGKAVARLTIPDDLLRMKLRPDGAVLAVLTHANGVLPVAEGHLWLLEVNTGKSVAGFEPFPCSGPGGEGAIAFCPAGRALALADDRGQVHVLDARTGAGLLTFSLGEDRAASLAFSPDGQALAVTTYAQRDGHANVALWDAKTGKRRWSPPVGASGVTAVAFSPDGKRLATGHADGSILLWGLPRWGTARPKPKGPTSALRRARRADLRGGP